MICNIEELDEAHLAAGGLQTGIQIVLFLDSLDLYCYLVFGLLQLCLEELSLHRVVLTHVVILDLVILQHVIGVRLFYRTA